MSFAIQPAELWTLEHGEDAVRCVAGPHPLGVEVRYVINEQPLIARVMPGWEDVVGIADKWRERLQARGWVPRMPRHMVVLH
jgi:hypothetical protein